MATYYVDGVNGNDSFSGSVSTPFLTIDKALNVIATSSDVIILTAQKGLSYRVTSISPFQTKSFTLKSDKNTYAVVDFNGLACNVATFGKRFEYLYIRNMGTWNSGTGTVSLVYENCAFEGIGDNASFWTNSSSVTMNSVLIRKFNSKAAEGCSVNLIRGVNSSSFTNLVILDCAGVMAYLGNASLSKSIRGSSVVLSTVSGDILTTTTNEESRKVNNINYGLLVSLASALAVSKILLSSGDKVLSMLPSAFNDNAIPAMTSNTSPSGVASASSQYSSTTYYPFYAFNRTNTGASDAWVTANGATSGWLQYKFNIPKVISKYTITNRNNGTIHENTPKSWTFEGSNNGEDWVVLDKIENNPVWTSVESRSFNFENENSYLYYRLSVTTIHSGVYVAIGKLEMHEYVKGLVYFLPNSEEETFIKYGFDQAIVNEFFKKEISVKQVNASLGSGKIFEHTVDMSKRRIDKIILI